MHTYDVLDQLVSETKNGVTTTWTYDAGGNILTKSHGDTIIEYKYEDENEEWNDLLTIYNGKTITYDEIGNPLTIGTDTTLTWEAGRRLSNITKAGVTTSFIYNADGYRTSKTRGGVTTTYHLDGGRITAMIKGTDELSFAYDENGLLTGLYHNGIAYAYAKNLQGDIIGNIDGNGNWVVTYEYDAWGSPIAIEGTQKDTLGNLNPFRYRGYVYDVETGFYYVSSRYYDTEIGRWLNSDVPEILFEDQDNILENNLYTYCFNNPVNYEDPSGYAATMMFRMGAQINLNGLGTSLLSIASSITPAGWVVIGVVVIGGVVYAKTKSKGDVDPYARVGQKKQGREVKSKSRQKSNFNPRNNKRDKKPAKPKKHTPSRKGHTKYK